MNPIHADYKEVETLDFPGVLTLKVLLTGKETNGALAVFEDIVEPGVGAPRHIHRDQDETFFFLEGEFDVEIGGKLYHMKPNDVGFIPKGTVHAFKNVGQTQGRLRYIFTPGNSIEEMFRAFYNAAQETGGEVSDEAMTEIALKHRQEIVGPPI